MKSFIQKFNKFVSSSLFGLGGFLLILQTMLMPNLLTGSVRNSFSENTIIAKEILAPTKIVYVTVTAYSSTPDQTDDTPFITANGSRVRDGIIAANFLAFGTKVRFPDYSGDKEYTVQDRMHRRFSDRADIWFATRGEALAFGIRTLKMEVYD